MKRILVLVLSFAAVFSVSAQKKSVLPFRADTIVIQKIGGSAELVIENQSKNTRGYLLNVGGGRTEFRRVQRLNDTTIVFGFDTVNVGKGTGGGGVANTKNPITKVGDSVAITTGVGLDVRANTLISKEIIVSNLGFMRGLATANLDTAYNYKLRIRGQDRDFYFDPNDAVTADDSATTIVTAGGKRLKAIFPGGIVTPKMFGAKGDGTTDDWWAFQKMWNFLAAVSGHQYQIVVEPVQSYYLINHTVTLPQTIPGAPIIDFVGYGALIHTDAAISIFQRLPADQSVAQNIVSDYRVSFRGVGFQGSSATLGQKALDIGATLGWSYEHCNFSFLDTAIALRFSLAGRITGCKFTQIYSVPILVRWGEWSGGSRANSASNSNTIDGQTRFSDWESGAHQTFASVMALGADEVYIRDVISEGGAPRYHFYLDNDLSTNVNTIDIDNLHIEGIRTYDPHSTIFRIKQAGAHVTIRNMQCIYPDTLYDMTGCVGGTLVNFDNITAYNIPTVPFIIPSSSAQTKIVFNKSVGPDLRIAAMDPASYQGGFLPTADVTVESYEASLGNVWTSTAGFYYNPNAFATDPDNKSFKIDANILFPTDDRYCIGCTSGTNARPKRLAVGTGGIYIDRFATLKFGSPGEITDLPKIGVDVAKNLTVFAPDEADTRNIRAKSFLSDSASYYTFPITDAQIPQYGFDTKQARNNAIADAVTGLSPDGYTIKSIAGETQVDTTVIVPWSAFTPQIGRVDSIQNYLDTVTFAGGGGLDTVAHDLTLSGQGKTANKLKTDTSVIATRSWVTNTFGGGGITGSGTTGKVPLFTGSTAIGNSILTQASSVLTSSGLIKYLTDLSGSYDARTLPDVQWVSDQITAITGGSVGDVTQSTIAALDGSSSTNTSKIYFITDPYKEGFYKYDVAVANQTTDDQGYYIVTADLKRFKRILPPDNSLSAAWFLVGSITEASVANTSVDTAVGTDWGPAINAVRTRAAAGQRIIVPALKIVFHSEVDTIKAKKVVMDWYCPEIHTNKRTIFRIYPPTTAPFIPGNVINVWGNLIGKENVGAHSVQQTSPYTKFTPNWAGMVGAGFELGNVIGNHIQVHQITAYYYGTLISVANLSAGSFGAQENSFNYGYIDRCAVANGMISLTGATFCDKNRYGGLFGGLAHIDAGLAVKIEGFPGVAANGENYDGEFGDNTWRDHLYERVDSLHYMAADVTETHFINCPIEAGLRTGIIGTASPQVVFKLKNTSPNFVRNTTYDGMEFIYTRWFDGATLGIGGSIDKTPMYANGAILIGQKGTIDQSGNLIVPIPPTLYKVYADAVPPIMKLIPDNTQAQEDITITTTPYSVPVGVRNVYVNVGGATVNLPTPNINIKREITVFNLGTSSTVNVPQANNTSIGINQSQTYYSDGASWRTKGNVSLGGSGTVTASNGLTAAVGNVTLGGTLNQNSSVSGAGFSLNMGTNASKLNFFSIYTGTLLISGKINMANQFTVTAPGGGTVTIADNVSYVRLNIITVNTTIQMPTGATSGDQLHIFNANTTSGIAYSISGTVIDPSGNTLTTFANNRTYFLVYDGGTNAWRQY